MIEAVIHGLIASGLTLLIFWPITYWMGANLTTFLGLNMYTYYWHNLPLHILVLVGSGVLIGVVSSFIAIRKYLRK